MSPRVLTTVAETRAALLPFRRAGQRIGLVPTMGALHEGHLSLVRASKAECDITVVWIYVNPSQFGPHEDLAKYPRTLAADLEKLAACDTDFVLAPERRRGLPTRSRHVGGGRIGRRAAGRPLSPRALSRRGHGRAQDVQHGPAGRRLSSARKITSRPPSFAAWSPIWTCRWRSASARSSARPTAWR